MKDYQRLRDEYRKVLEERNRFEVQLTEARTDIDQLKETLTDWQEHQDTAPHEECTCLLCDLLQCLGSERR